jgi:hypothetical protein
MSYFEDRPFESWFDELTEAASGAYSGDAATALGLTQQDLTQIIADHQLEHAEAVAAGAGGTFHGLGQGEGGPLSVPFMLAGGLMEDIVLPWIFNQLYGAQKRRAKKAILFEVKQGVFRAGEALGNAVVHQMMAIGEQGELLSRYKNSYGVVKNSTDPNARCK